MTSSDNGCDNGSFEENTSLHVKYGSSIPPPQQVEGELNTSDPVFEPAGMLAALNSLLAEQLRKFVMEVVQAALQDSQASEQENLSNKRKEKHLVSEFLLVSSRIALHLPARWKFSQDH
ncbi:UNVERIFIED_CONTAM: hypothetical protein Slati_1147200 [Sesamum latifolium]|uniref:Uncharacterized protein n=1 Tax=Sesamum latifolium TaxID=2727402 RepID=A0AAW2XHK8_9LAMI